MISTRKRGPIYHVDYIVGSNRLRGSLGTKDKNVASRLKSRIEVSMAEGSKSAGWSDLRRVLPADTYHRFSSHAGLAKHAESTWSGLLSIFWKDCERRKLKKGSVVRYQSTVDRFTEFLSGRKIESLTVISKELVLEFRDWREAAIAKNSRSRGGSGLYQDMSCLRFIMTCAVENGLIVKNPVQRELRPDIVRGTAPYSGEELGRMRDVCTSEELLVFAIFRHTGMRGSDVADLRWKDVHFVDGEIVRQAIKNGKLLQIPMHPELEEVLVSAHQWQRSDDQVIKIGNKSATREQLARFMHLIELKAKVTGGHNHRLRASYATDALMKGLSVFEVAQLLGDESKTVERHYLRFVPAMRSRVKELMEDETRGLEAVCSIG